MRIWVQDPELFDPGSEMEKFGSGMFIPDPQHWTRGYALVVVTCFELMRSSCCLTASFLFSSAFFKSSAFVCTER
jgi:hypothetical protein